MSLRCLDSRRGAELLVALVAMASLLLAACEREQRRFSEGTRASRLLVHGAAPDAQLADQAQLELYAKNAWAIAEGQRLFAQMNCVGCHSHGGGGMGPPLMDATWIYGAGLADIERSIMEGRPRGMPAFSARLSPQQVWQLVAFVRSLSGHAPASAAPGRDDHMAVRPPPARTKPEPLVPRRVN